MYTKDKSVRITFRCDDKLGDWVAAQAAMIGVTPSAFVRQSLFGMMASQARLAGMMEQSLVNAARTVEGINFNEVASTAKAVTDEHDQRNQ